jgi:hypothetical protein
MADEKLSDKKWRVTGAYVTFPTMTTDGRRVVGRYKGARLPADVPEETLAHFVKMGLIEEDPDAPPPTRATGDPGEAGAPDMTTEDKTPAKARPVTRTVAPPSKGT